MDAPTAALVGAAGAATIGLFSQYIAHRLSVRREQLAQRRERLNRVIEEAALALQSHPGDRETPPGPAGSLAGSYPALTPLVQRVSRGFALLRIHFGMTHPLVTQYAEAFKAVMDSECAQVDALRKRDDSPEAIDTVARVLVDASSACETWTQSARYYVDYDLRPGHRRSQRRIRRDMRNRLWTSPSTARTRLLPPLLRRKSRSEPGT